MQLDTLLTTYTPTLKPEQEQAISNLQKSYLDIFMVVIKHDNKYALYYHSTDFFFDE